MNCIYVDVWGYKLNKVNIVVRVKSLPVSHEGGTMVKGYNCPVGMGSQQIDRAEIL